MPRSIEPTSSVSPGWTATLKRLVVSEPWDSGSVGGDEVDVDWLLPAPEAAASLVAA